MRSFVAEPMQHGRLFLAGDAAHIVPPTGAKGLNLADRRRARAGRGARRLVRSGDDALLDGYSTECLRRVWRAEHFSWWMTAMLHRPVPDDPFAVELQRAELRYLTTSEPAARRSPRTTSASSGSSGLASRRRIIGGVQGMESHALARPMIVLPRGVPLLERDAELAVIDGLVRELPAGEARRPAARRRGRDRQEPAARRATRAGVGGGARVLRPAAASSSAASRSASSASSSRPVLGDRGRGRFAGAAAGARPIFGPPPRRRRGADDARSLRCTASTGSP